MGISFRDVHGIAEELGVDVQTVRRWIQSGSLRAFKPGKEYRVRESDLEEFLAAREVRPKMGARPEVEKWLAAHRHRDEDQFRSYVEALDLAIDEEGRPRGLEDAIVDLRHTRDRLLQDLKRPATRNALFPRRSGLPTKDERIREALRPAKEAWKLEWEIRHEYLAREIELINRGRRLLEGATEHESRLEELLEAAYAQAGAA